jgi:hypothetical protein
MFLTQKHTASTSNSLHANSYNMFGFRSGLVRHGTVPHANRTGSSGPFLRNELVPQNESP